MKINEAKKELKNYCLDKKSYLDEMEEELKLRSKAEGVTTSYEARYSAGKSDKSKVEEYSVLLLKHAEEMDERLKVDETRLNNVRQAIHKLPNPYKQILIELYFNGNDLQRVAAILANNYKTVSSKHIRALELYCEIRNRDLN